MTEPARDRDRVKRLLRKSLTARRTVVASAVLVVYLLLQSGTIMREGLGAKVLIGAALSFIGSLLFVLELEFFSRLAEDTDEQHSGDKKS